MITLKGQTYFMNRLVNNEVEPINGVVIGKGRQPPRKEDETLSNPGATKPCKAKINPNNNNIILTIELTQEELGWISEIGATSNGVLLTHDLVGQIPEDVSKLEYIIEVDTISSCNQWKVYQDNIYYCFQPNKVKEVEEVGTGSSYHKSWGLTSMTNGSYFYDNTKHLLYIITMDGSSPNGKSIHITNK